MSTVPATAGQTVGLFLRERALPFTLEQHSPHVVLMVHGGFAPSMVAYDLQYRATVSWLGNGSVDGMAQGEFYANAAGTLGPLQV